MPDDAVILNNVERVRASIMQGESHFREFKSAVEGEPGKKRARDAQTIRKDIGEALVAFANADGGELFIGIEDDGTITGVPHNESVVETFFAASRTNVLPSTPLSASKGRIYIDEKLVILLAVEKSLRFIHQTSDGKTLQRSDRETLPVSNAAIHIERKEEHSRKYDRSFIDGATMADLEPRLLDALVKAMGGGLSPEKALQLIELSEYAFTGLRLRRAALLLFAKNIQRWHPRCEVRILRVNGTEIRTVQEYNVETLEIVTQPIASLIPESWEALKPHLSRTVYAGGMFESRITYPDDACLEALVNAIAHRDYSNEGIAIEVFLFDDRLEFRSPGSLLSTVTVQGLSELRGVHQSRNAFLARGLRELGIMREMGEGMRRIFQLLRQGDLLDPELRAEDESFSITIFHRSVFSQAAQRWLAAFERFNLGRDERKVVLLGRDEAIFSPDDIMSTAEITDTDDYRILVETLQLKGILISTLTKSQVSNIATKARRNSGGISRARRGVPRYGVRNPRESEQYLAELTRSLRGLDPRTALSTPDLVRIGKGLVSGSPYKGTLLRSLQALGLVDEQRRPIIP